MHQFKGSIDFANLPEAIPATLPIHTDSQWSRLELPGLSLKWHQSLASLTTAHDVLVLSAGRPRFPRETGSGTSEQSWLEMYRNSNDIAAHEVGGGFAAILLDLRQRRCLMLNDRFSMETLCYRVGNGELGFSDNAAEVPGSGGEIDPQVIYDYLCFHMIPAPATVFRDVRRLQAGEVLACGSSGLKSNVWHPKFEEHDFRDLQDRLRQFRDITSNSVAEEADDQSTACFLSGGTDSSTIAGMLTRLRGKPAPCYSIGFEAEGYDEMEYARIAARHFGLDHREYYLTPNDLVAGIPLVAAAADQPFGNSSILPAYYCALKAKEDGFDRMLAGDGGDELFGGNARYARQTLFDYYDRVPAALKAVIEPPAVNWPVFRRVPGLRQLGGYVRHARIPMPDRMESFNLMRNLGKETILTPDFLTGIDTQRPLALQQKTWHEARANSLLNRMLAYDWKYTLADSDLPKVRMATQLAGVTVGYPFLSRAMADFSLSLPPHWKLKNFKLRWFFKEALRNVLPQEILSKKKHGFGLPFGLWVLRHNELRALATDSLRAIANRGIVRPDFVDELLKHQLAKAPGYYGELVWVLMMLEQWLAAKATKFHL